MFKLITRYNKRASVTYIQAAVIIIIVAAFFLPSRTKLEETGDNMFTVYLNGTKVGVVGETAVAEECLQEVRKEIACGEDGLVFIDVDMNLEGQEVLFGKIDSKEAIKREMRYITFDSIKETMQRSYVIKVNNYMVNLGGMEEVRCLLQEAVNQYDTEQKFAVQLVHDSNREFNVLTARIEDTEEKNEVEEAAGTQVLVAGGIQGKLFSMFEDIEPIKEKGFEDFDLGLLSMSFAEEVEIVEAYLNASAITPLEIAVEQVTKEQEVSTIYEVVSGDTLSEISIKVNIPIDKLIEMNDALQNENSTIRVGQELIITVPEPELSVDRQEEVYYEGAYEADVIYIPRDDWYTTQTKTIQEPSAGFRKAIAVVSYRNEKETGREIIKEEIIMEAVPKIVERGTKIPPTYIKPISGGRLSSGFGKRSAPTKGASTYHKGVDWAVPVGTTVVASSAGTVAKAGWGSGYGYVVYINHADGRQTRYGHLSKVLVSVGQTVSQGQKIALSGNTGVSSGPHVHFEILIKGSQVNPLNYLN